MRPPKPDLTDEELRAWEGMIARGTYRGTGLRAGANLVSALRGAHEASTPKAKAKRTVSARWLERQLVKRGITPSAAKLRFAKIRGRVRRTEKATAYTGPRITRKVSTVVLAGVQQYPEPLTIGMQEVAKGGSA